VESGLYSDISRRRIDYWSEPNLSLSLFSYKPGDAGQFDEATQFILRFKEFDRANDDSACLQAAVMQVYDAVLKYQEKWTESDCRYIVPVPSHAAHRISDWSRDLCRLIAGMCSWLQYPEQLLFRRETVVPAHQAYAGQHPTSIDHFQSLAYRDADLGGAGVILFDDIVTTGDTSQACRRRLQSDLKCGEVVRLFLGRTERSSAS
jgi:predicted amidophosphoribosyltransferase